MLKDKDVEEIVGILLTSDDKTRETLLEAMDEKFSSYFRNNEDYDEQLVEEFSELYPTLLKLIKSDLNEYIRSDAINVLYAFTSLFDTLGIYEEGIQTYIEAIQWDNSISVKTSAVSASYWSINDNDDIDEIINENIPLFLDLYKFHDNCTFQRYFLDLIRCCFYYTSNKEYRNQIIYVFRYLISTCFFGRCEDTSGISSAGSIALECDKLNRNHIVYDLIFLLKQDRNDEINKIVSDTLQEIAIKFEYFCTQKLIAEYESREDFEIEMDRRESGYHLVSTLNSLTCFYCGYPNKKEVQTCIACDKRLAKCIIYKLSISFREPIGKCSLCETIGHLDRLLEWMKIKGKCPKMPRKTIIRGYSTLTKINPKK